MRKLQFSDVDYSPEQDRCLSTHRAYLIESNYITSELINIGDIIKFMYLTEERTVFVLQPNWKDKLHGLSFKSLDHETFMKQIYPRLDRMHDPTVFYETVVDQPNIIKLKSYRTYNINEMGRVILYKYRTPDMKWPDKIPVVQKLPAPVKSAIEHLPVDKLLK